MTALETAASPDYARQLTDRIKVAVEGTWHLITEAYQSRAWSSLGYSSWDDYCTREFGTSRLRLPREERAETVQSLRDAGLSLRAIAAVTGDSKDTISRALAPVSNETPEPARQKFIPLAEVAEMFGVDLDEPDDADDPWAQKIADELAASDNAYAEQANTIPAAEPVKVTGVDGKQYTSQVKRAPYRKPLPDVARGAGFELRKSMERVERLFADDRYRSNEKQVADALRGHLLYVADTVAAVLAQIP